MHNYEERLRNWSMTPDTLAAIHLDAALFGVPENEMVRLKIVGLSRSLNATASRVHNLEKDNELSRVAIFGLTKSLDVAASQVHKLEKDNEFMRAELKKARWYLKGRAILVKFFGFRSWFRMFKRGEGQQERV